MTEIRRIDKAPEGWRRTIGATTAPLGYIWYNNGRSRFSGQRESALVREAIK